jgi:hypothetical protein
VVRPPGAGEALLGGRIEATIDEDKPSGFLFVAFPVVKGTKPLSPESQRDTSRIYRKWAITAPWSVKGWIHERADYPKLLIKAPYCSVEMASWKVWVI